MACTACPLLRAHLGSRGPSLRGWHPGTVVGTAARGGQHGPSGPLLAGRRSDRPMSLGKFLPPQDLEDTQLSDKGEDTRRLSRRNLTKASSWWQVGSCLDLQYTRCMMLVPGDARPSPGPMTFTPQFKDGHIGAQTQLFVVLISLIIRDVEYFSCATWPFTFPLWKNVYSVEHYPEKVVSNITIMPFSFLYHADYWNVLSRNLIFAPSLITRSWSWVCPSETKTLL